MGEIKIETGDTNISAITATKFCKHCGKQIDIEAVVCINCGKQVEELKSVQAQVVINNSNMNTNTNNNTNMPHGIKPKNKWVAFLLCLIGFMGIAGVHKFYERRILLGILYLITFGFLGIGTLIDAIILLFKPNPYYI